jgi:uncharacterized membrane-anchored protein
MRCVTKPLVLAALLLLSPLHFASAQDKQMQVAWQNEPLEAKLGDQAVLTLTADYRFLGPADTQRLLRATGNFPSGAELGLVTPLKGEENWFVVIRYIDAGYIKDDDADNWDADAMLASIKEGTEEANKKRKEMGIEPLIVRGWEEKPHYDKAENKVVWVISNEAKDGVGVNYNTLALGRHGYISMNMVGELKELPQLKPHTRILLGNLNFVQGKSYTDFDSATDKVAAVGLAALVAGAAFKAGLLAKLWAFLLPAILIAKKLIIVIVIAIAGLVAKFLKKRSPSPVSRA